MLHLWLLQGKSKYPPWVNHLAQTLLKIIIEFESLERGLFLISVHFSVLMSHTVAG